MDADPYGIPENFFGPLDPELPALIGRVTMLATLLELKLAHLASSIDNGMQHTYISATASDNLRLCRQRLKLYNGSDMEVDFANRTQALLPRIRRAVTDRNDVVHRIWPHASPGQWAGWKAKRHLDSDNPEWTTWDEYTHEWFTDLAARLIKLIDETSDAIAYAGGIPRRADIPVPDPFDGLDRPTVLALGRVAWAAINLEDRATTIGEAVKGPRGRTPIGPFLESAVTELKSKGANEYSGSIDWLTRTRSMLTRRNAILHSVPVTKLDPDTNVTIGQSLTHFPNDGSGAIETPLSADPLNEIATDAQEIKSEWIPILREVSARDLGASGVSQA
jgi:hypothetical protein